MVEVRAVVQEQHEVGVNVPALPATSIGSCGLDVRVTTSHTAGPHGSTSELRQSGRDGAECAVNAVEVSDDGQPDEAQQVRWRVVEERGQLPVVADCLLSLTRRTAGEVTAVVDPFAPSVSLGAVAQSLSLAEHANAPRPADRLSD